MSRKGRGRRQQPARCWFCGGEGVTQEHILARSLTKLFTSPQEQIADPDIRPRFRHDYERPDQPGVTTKRANWLAYKTRKFCRACNNGWMQEVDQAALPKLAAFARNEPTTLDGERQQRVALWVTKILFGFQAREPHDLRCVDRSFFRELCETRKPLAGSQVWLGANSHGHVAFANAHTLTFAQHFPDESRGFGASLSFGYANFHVLFHGSDSMLLRLRSPLAQAFSPIWPAGADVDWPPRSRISDRDLSWLANDFGGRSEFVPRGARVD